ncbi:hypothetical protein CJ030_MR6G011332 [Morella rubra]|uniref:Methyltransferase type 11 domain-containing protein n=1 Tax=Morella rubra TaxID=262757 RepID=A0A6A1V7R4_9ROSI|nr:hypothetical protein CJ030_MR7G012937 [Morella rubra]KAB1210092.1 hypothetical protein CJ030_MR6G011332 [Morella rubra]
MDRHIEIFLKRLSFAAITIATLTLLLLFLQTPQTCIPPNSPPKPHLKFPKSSCDFSPRELLPLDKKNRRLWSSKAWQSRVSSLSQFFTSIRDLGLLHNHSKVLCVSAGAGHEVMALSNLGVLDVTGVELIDSPPLVSRADPHNLPFFDGVFDLVYTGHLEEALFPARFVSEMERTVRDNGVCVVVVEECGNDEVRKIVDLFRHSSFVGAAKVSLIGLRMTRIVMRTRKFN